MKIERKTQITNDETEDNIKKKSYIKEFEDNFNIKNMKIDISKLPLLKHIFHLFGEDVYTSSREHRKLRRKSIKLSEELENIFTEEQFEKFKEYWEIQNQLSEEVEEQLFMYGYIIGQELKNELNDSTTIKGY